MKPDGNIIKANYNIIVIIIIIVVVCCQATAAVHSSDTVWKHRANSRGVRELIEHVVVAPIRYYCVMKRSGRARALPGTGAV